MKYMLKLKPGFGLRSCAGFGKRGFLKDGDVVDESDVGQNTKKPSFPFELVPVEQPKRQRRQHVEPVDAPKEETASE